MCCSRFDFIKVAYLIGHFAAEWRKPRTIVDVQSFSIVFLLPLISKLIPA